MCVYNYTQTVDALPYWGNDNSENTCISQSSIYSSLYLVSWTHGKLTVKDIIKLKDLKILM